MLLCEKTVALSNYPSYKGLEQTNSVPHLYRATGNTRQTGGLMGATNYTGVYESRGKLGVTVLKIKYSIGDRQKKETLGVKGALIQRGEGEEKLTPALASLIRADRITQFARKGEEVLKRHGKVPTLEEGWNIVQAHMESEHMSGLRPWRGTWNVYIKDRFGAMPMDEIDETMIQKALKDWRTSPAFHTVYGAPPKPATINQAVKLMLRIYRFMQAQNKYYGRIPLGGGKDKIGTVKPKTKRMLKNKSDHYFKPEEAEMVLEACRAENHDLWLQCIISLLTGARQLEICGETTSYYPDKEPHHGLRWRDIDWDRKQITFLRKGDEYQTIPVSDEVLSILRKEVRGAANQKVTGPRWQREAWERVVGRLELNDEGVERKNKAVFHSWRHTFATWYLQSGGNLKDLSSLMNHKDIETTAGYLTESKETQIKGNAGVTQMLRDAKKAKFGVVGGRI